MTDGELARLTAGFLAMLDRMFVQYGEPGGLPPPLRRAVQAVPRHRFVHRFRIGDGPLRDADADPAGCLPAIYSDEVMRHVDEAGALLESTNSQPSYVLWLLHLLQLRPGARVLEIGSGSGWLAAIMAELTGSGGSVTGIEILPGLAAQSRIDLGPSSPVRILAGDGTAGVAGGQFDRAMITAGIWDVPAALLDQVVDGGVVLLPIELRGEVGCQVSVLRRRADRFVLESSVAGWFVPLVGASQTRARRTPVSGPAMSRYPLGLGRFTGRGGEVIASQFRAFLGRTEPGFTVFTAAQAPDMAWTSPSVPFGIAEEGSQAVCGDGELAGHGSLAAAQRLAQAYRRWCDFGLPGMGAFGLEVVRTGADPGGEGPVWVEERGGTSLVWRLPAGSGGWRTLLPPSRAGS